MVLISTSCCGMFEIAKFPYDKQEFFFRFGGKSVTNSFSNLEEELRFQVHRARVYENAALVIATTINTQTKAEKVLRKVGFTKSQNKANRINMLGGSPITLWTLSLNKRKLKGK